MDYENASSGDSDRFGSISELTQAEQAPAAGGGPALALPDAENRVALPSDAVIQTVEARADDLLIELADGRTFVVVGGAADLPVVVIGGVPIPPDSLQALLAGNAPAPAAGPSPANLLEPDAQGNLVLPEGATLDSITVRGSDLIVQLPSGISYVIPRGAVYVPRLTLDGVEVPSQNLAALLTGQEPEPAAGDEIPRGSGGNFFDPNAPLQDAFDLGDLLPYTQLFFESPLQDEVLIELADRRPSVLVETADQPSGAVDAAIFVAEAGLPARGAEPAGSNAAADSEIAIGAIAFDPGDGLASITINGVVLTGETQTFVSDRGTLSVGPFDPASGKIPFSFTLTDNTTAGSPPEQFTILVTDTDGDTATGTITVAVLDDAPDAVDDTDSVAAGSFAAESGNVVTAQGTTSAGVDTLGADNASVTAIASINQPANAATGSGPGQLRVEGQFGVLTVAADGSYSYQRDPGTPGGVEDVFVYTLTDADGSADTATLTISIGDSTPDVRVPLLGAAAAGTQVDEAGLPARTIAGIGEPAGSNAAASLETTSGTITFTAADGPASVTVAGTPITGEPGQTITLPGGVLTITGLNLAAGTLGYSFTLTDNTLGDATAFDLPVVVTDADGDAATATLTITVIDDVPAANDDAAAQTVRNAPVTVNVLANDTPGADGIAPEAIAAVPGSLTGAGTLVSNGDGTFTYTPAPGEVGPVTFRYTITDADGDSDTAEVTITLIDDTAPTIVSTSALVLDEDGRPGANPDSTPLRTDPAETASTGSTVADGLVVVDFGGDLPAVLAGAMALVDSPALDGQLVTLAGAPVAFALENGALVGRGGDGAVVVTITLTQASAGPALGQVSYGYQAVLSQAVRHAGSGEDSVLLTGVSFAVTDLDGDTAQGSFDVTVVDDIPAVSAALAAGVSGVVDESGLAAGVAAIGLGGLVQGSDPHAAAGVPTLAVGGSGGLSLLGVSALYGADGIGAGPAYSFAVADGAPAGVVTTSGEAIVLVQLSDTVVAGRIGAGPQAAFAVELDAATGAVRIEQYVSLRHPDATDPDDPVSLAGSGLAVAVRVSDGDGDPAQLAAPVEVGGRITFADDGPSVSAALAAGVSGVVDESALAAGVAAIGLGGLVQGSDPHAAAGVPTLAVGGSGGLSLLGVSALYGADGIGAGPAYSFAVADGAPAGVVTTAGEAIVLVQLSDTVVAGRIGAGPQAAFAIELDAATGAVRIEQYVSLRHPDAADPNDPVSLAGSGLAVAVRVSDGDGDPAGLAAPVEVGGRITFADDGPSVSAALAAGVSGVVDESALAAGVAAIGLGGLVQGSDPHAAAGVPTLAVGGSGGLSLLGVSALYGADGIGAGPAYSFAVADGAPAGVVTTAGEAIVLVQLSDTVVAGRIGAGPQAAFAVELDAATGAVRIEQYVSLRHPDAADPNDPVSLAGSGLAVAVRVSDGDGDPAGLAAPVEVGGRITFADDGPSVSAALAAGVSGVVDESALAAGVAAIGLGGLVQGSDPHAAAGVPTLAVGGSGGLSLLGVSALYGADGIGAGPAYSFAVADGAPAGVVTTAGEAIVLVQLSDTVVAGRIGAGPQAAFAVELDAATGAVRIEQYVSLRHPDAADPDDPVSLAGSGLAVAVRVSDGDGDPAGLAAPVEVGGRITFADDGPSVSAALAAGVSGVVDESALAAGVAAIGLGGLVQGSDPHAAAGVPTLAVGGSGGLSLLGVSALYGADGIGAGPAYSFVVADGAPAGVVTTAGEAIVLVQLSDTVVAGRIGAGPQAAFAVELDAATGAVRIEQYVSLRHPDATDPDDPVSLAGSGLAVAVRVSDGDGDPAQLAAPVAVGDRIVFADDGPMVSAALAAGVSGVVDESALAAGVAAIGLGGLVQGSDPHAAAGVPMLAVGGSGGLSLLGVSALYGADGIGAGPAYSFAVADGAPAGVVTTAGEAIVLVQLSDTVVAGRIGAGPQAAFAVELDAATGAVRIEQYVSLRHPDATDPDDPVSLAGSGLAVAVRVSDGDGDPAGLAAPVEIGGRITFADDGPRVADAGVGAGVTLDETTAVTLAAGFPISATSASSAIRGVAVFGADGPASAGATGYSLTIASSGGVTPLRTAIGDFAITLVQVDATTIAGRYDDGVARTAFTLSIGGDGRVTVTQFVPLEHNLDGSSPAAYDDPLTLIGPGGASLVNAVLTVTDGDNDSVSASVGIGGGIRFEDDGPLLDLSVVASPPLLADQTAGGGGADAIGFAQGLLFTISAASAGADGEASRVFLLTVTDSGSGLIDLDTGEAVVLSLESGTVVGRTAFTGDRVFDLSVDDQTGETTLVQFRAVQQDGDADALVASLTSGSIGLAGTLADNDGDHSTSTVDISTLVQFRNEGTPGRPTAGGSSFGDALMAGLGDAAPVDRRAAELSAAVVAGGGLLAMAGTLAAATQPAAEPLPGSSLSAAEPTPESPTQELPTGAPIVRSAGDLLAGEAAAHMRESDGSLAPAEVVNSAVLPGHDGDEQPPQDATVDQAAPQNLAPAAAMFDPGVDGSELMLALLAAAQGGSGAAPDASGADADAAGQVLAEAAGSELADAVVARFAGDDTADPAGSENEDLTAMLYADIAGSAAAPPMHPEAMNPADDLNAMALAVA